MGLDIYFKKQAAIAAGLVTDTRQRGTQAEIERTLEYSGADWYYEDLKKLTTFIQVPTKDWWLDGGSGEIHIVVRANKWGDSYAPLTKWLEANNITWGEF